MEISKLGWKEYAFLIALAIAGALAVHWGLVNFIAPGPKRLSKAASDAETRFIATVSVHVYQALSASPPTDPMAGLPSHYSHAAA